MKITDELLYQHAAEARDIWQDKSIEQCNEKDRSFRLYGCSDLK